MVGRIQALWRYPVKSMQGEQLDRARLTPDGIPGDRGVAVVDAATGRVISGKRLEQLLGARAVARPGGPAIVLPDGTTVHWSSADAASAISAWLGRPVRLEASVAEARPMIESEDGHVFLGRPRSFFDSAALHLLTTATLDHLAGLYPDGAFDARRFRPNLVIATDGEAGLVEQGWVGAHLRIGGTLLEVVKPCTRCVMTTSEQADLPKDRGILATVAREAGNVVGVHARTLEPGMVAVGDPVELR